MLRNLEERLETGVVTVRISDHLPVFAFVGGQGGDPGGWEDKGTQRKMVTGADEAVCQVVGGVGLEEWDWREVRALGVEENWVRFGNEFWDMYNCAFPVAKRRKRDVEKPWLDDVDFKELVREKGELYSRKIRRKLREGRLAEVTKEVRG